MGDKTIVVTRSDDGVDDDDPVIDQFLTFIAADIQTNSSSVRPIPQDLLTRARDVTDGVLVDLDAPLGAEDE